MARLQMPRSREWQYLVLLPALFLLLLGGPFLPGDGVPVVLLTLVLLGGVGVAARNRIQLAVAVVLAVAALAGSVLAADRVGTPGGLWVLAAWAALVAHTIGLTLTDVLSARVGRGAALAGGLSTYLLLGLLFALGHVAIESAAPGSYSGVVDGQELWAELYYLSYVTLTTLGYGDVAPVAQDARMLCAAEAVVGVLFVGVFVARLVSTLASDREPQE